MDLGSCIQNARRNHLLKAHPEIRRISPSPRDFSLKTKSRQGTHGYRKWISAWWLTSRESLYWSWRTLGLHKRVSDIVVVVVEVVVVVVVGIFTRVRFKDESSEIEIASWGAEHPNIKGFQLQGVFGNNQPTTRATQALLRDHPLASRMIQPHVRKMLSNSNRKQYFPGTLLAAPDFLKPFQYL